ncbi:hypothetical protein INS49_013221 [Diaporthe citri]|uniref:uncharacterized protein n=1 Tax=Diaporthe citri TaxID=83186 RepID=UPI001C8160B3|nr:uncharacterized protein INS49_013221 [Diaporthe citri]KAG6357345.1 hypothetical protein INS49_013221 [Diaporthe citri]
MSLKFGNGDRATSVCEQSYDHTAAAMPVATTLWAELAETHQNSSSGPPVVIATVVPSSPSGGQPVSIHRAPFSLLNVPVDDSDDDAARAPNCFIQSTPGSIRVVESASGGARSFRLAVNGAEIKPAYVGPPLAVIAQRRPPMFPRYDGICDGEWVPLRGKEDYTRPADGTQIVSGLYTGPVDVSITTTRTQSWSTTIDTSIGFEDVLSLLKRVFRFIV